MRHFIVLFAAVFSCTANPLERATDQADAVKDSKLSGETTLAVDVSVPVSVAGFQCIRQSFYNIAFIRAYTPAGQGQTDPYACANSKNADAAGLLSEVYMTPQPISTKTGAQQLDEILTMFSNCGVTVVSLWIQVTSPDNWSRTLSTNLNFLNSIFSRAGQYGVSIGIYTSSSEWNSITDYAKITNANLWYWNVHGGGVPNETPANFNDFRSFGGWTSPSVKQFAQTEGFCGITANRDVCDVGMNAAAAANFKTSDKIVVGRLGRGSTAASVKNAEFVQ